MLRFHPSRLAAEGQRQTSISLRVRKQGAPEFWAPPAVATSGKRLVEFGMIQCPLNGDARRIARARCRRAREPVMRCD